MKNYFSFNLTGQKLLLIWLAFLAFFMVPYVVVIMRMQNLESGDTSALWMFPFILVIIVLAFAITFFIIRLVIENIALGGHSIEFHGSFGKFIGTILLGYFLSIITLGIYMAWFMRDINRFFVNNSSYKSSAFIFRGKGGQLFVILLLTIFIPIIILSVFMAQAMVDQPNANPTLIMIQQVITWIIMIPYMYLVYKWMVNIDYKNYNISWETEFWSSCGKIAVEMILSIITFGIYLPLAWLRVYTYFAERTVAYSEEKEYGFGYDLDQLNDFLFLWGQILLTIVTLGIYYPWAICKSGSRILGKTYMIAK